MASLGAAVNISSKGIGGVSSQSNPLAGSGKAVWSGQLVSVGVPKTVKIVSSWDKSLSTLDCKKGRRSKSSANIHPTLHMSAASEYSKAPRRSSGGLYQSVMAWGLMRVFGVPYMRARPKSPNFIVPSFRNKRLSGLRSLWRIQRSWQAATAIMRVKICCLISASPSGMALSLIIFSRSV